MIKITPSGFYEKLYIYLKWEVLTEEELEAFVKSMIKRYSVRPIFANDSFSNVNVLVNYFQQRG